MSKNNLYHIRTIKRVSLTELAQQVGVSRQLLWGFEKGRNNISFEVLEKTANLLNVSQKQILGKEEIDKIDDSVSFDKKSVFFQRTRSSDKKELTELNNVYFRDTMEILEELCKDKNLSSEQKIELASEIYKKVAEYKKEDGEKEKEIEELISHAKIEILVNEGLVKFFSKEKSSKILKNNINPANEPNKTENEKGNLSENNERESKIIN
jgi:transcriptional regulator with XRE-family HTH domain